MNRRLVASATWLLVSILGSACAAPTPVVRIYNGHEVQGPAISSAAYAAFTRGALAQAQGEWPTALVEYTHSHRALLTTGINDTRRSEEEATVLSRMALMRCLLGHDERETRAVFSKLETEHAAMASIWMTDAECAVRRGRWSDAARSAERAAYNNPSNVRAIVLAVTMHARARGYGDTARVGRDDDAIERVRRRFAGSEGDPDAWDSLVALARAHRDPELLVQAYEGLAHAAPARRGELLNPVIELEHAGQIHLARRLAVTAIGDEHEHPHADGLVACCEAAASLQYAHVGRLAVDEALASSASVSCDKMHDSSSATAGLSSSALCRERWTTVRRRAIRAHMPDDELAARALYFGHVQYASDIASERQTASSDQAACPRLILDAIAASAASAASRDRRHPPESAKRGFISLPSDDTPPRVCLLVYALTLAPTADREGLRQWLSPLIDRSRASSTAGAITLDDPLEYQLMNALHDAGALDAPAPGM